MMLMIDFQSETPMYEQFKNKNAIVKRLLYLTGAILVYLITS